MRITVPVSRPDEVVPLAENGADELYCGFVPRAWLERYGGAFWLNRRGPVSGNFVEEDDVALAAERAHARGVPLFAALNAPYYVPEQQEYLLGLVVRLVGHCGIDGVIVSDPGFVVAVRAEFPDLAVHASSVSAALNDGMVDFLAARGVRRVIFPRGVRLADLRALCAAAAGRMETEAFVLNEGCVFEEGYCMTTHRAAGALCVQLAEVPHRILTVGSERHAAGGTASAEAGRVAMGAFRDWVWFQNGCGNSVTERGIPNGPCGLCALHDLARAGLSAVKIAGRSASPSRKLASLRMTRAVLDLVEEGASPGCAAETAKALRGTPEYCASRYMCYYREEA